MKYTDRVRDLEQTIYSEMIEYIKQHGYIRNVYGYEALFVDIPCGVANTPSGEPVLGFLVMKKANEELLYLDKGDYNTVPDLHLIEVANALDKLLDRAKINIKQSFDAAMKIIESNISVSLTKVQACEIIRLVHNLNDYQYALLITMIDEATA